MIAISEIFDSYGRKARLFPAFLTAIPLFASAFVYMPTLELGGEHFVWVIAGAAVMYFLADAARRRGKNLEHVLVAEWGGYPTKLMLRHSDSTVDAHTKSRYHRKAEALADGLTMPTEAEENVNPAEADSRYESTVRFLLANTRDPSKFGLLLKENITYGFRRNLYALKPVALLLVGGCSALPLYFSWEEISGGSLPQQPDLYLLLFFLLVLCCWLVLVTRQSVREAADEYARQLLTSFDVL